MRNCLKYIHTNSRGYTDDNISYFADGNTVVFIVIPFDKLKSHANYLRLVVTTLIRSAVRRPSDHKTTFICDEAFNLGYISEFETALSGYAGFNITMWLVYQDLTQIKDTYGDKWETMIANCTVKQFVARDVFTQEYVSKLMGDTTHVIYRQGLLGNIINIQSNQRHLATPNEVVRISKDKMITFIDETPVTLLPKIPYYDMPELKDKDGRNLYGPNPYVKDSK